MFRKYVLLLFFPLAGFSSLAAQMLPDDIRDPVLVDFIENKTDFSGKDAVPATTTYGDKQLAFPWLYNSKSKWENLASTLSDPYFKDVHERNLQAIQKLARGRELSREMDFESMIPERTYVRTLKKWVEWSTVAWYITRDSVYLDIARRALWVASHKESWGLRTPGRSNLNSADLGTGEMMYVVSFGYDALFPYLDETLKRDCIKALIEKGLRTYLNGILNHDWWEKCDFNWNSALNGNAGIAAMVIRDANPELSDFVLQKATGGLPYMISAFYPGGGWIEGVMYQGTAIGHLTDFIVPYQKLTGKDLGLMKNEDFQNTLSFWIPMFAPDGYAYNFSDCDEKNSLYGISQGFWWAHELNHPEWAWDQERRTSHETGRGGLFWDVESFWYREVNQESSEPELPRFIHFKGIDWAVWRGDKSWLAFRGGSSGGNHDNNDLGQFILGHGQDRFLIDPGYGAIKASEHNCITLHSLEQTDCATAPVTRSFEYDDGFYLECDIQQAFPFATSFYNRHLLLLDDNHLLLLDDVKGTGERRVSVEGHFQTRYPVERTGNGWKITGPTETCNIGLLFHHALLQEEKWNFRGPITKLKYWNYSDRVHSIQPVLFSFNDEPYTFSSSPEGFTLEVGGKIHEFRFADGELVYMGSRRRESEN